MTQFPTNEKRHYAIEIYIPLSVHRLWNNLGERIDSEVMRAYCVGWWGSLAYKVGLPLTA